MLVVALVVLTVAGAAVAGGTQRQPLPPWREPLPAARATAEIVVGDTTVPVELALTGSEQSLGLGYRNGLDPDAGMLFVFAEPSERSFWMKGMRFCLDIIWIAGGRIVGAEESVCPAPAGTPDSDLESYPSGQPVTHVLEVNAGWLEAHGYGVGTPVKIPDGLTQARVAAPPPARHAPGGPAARR
jgi:hypothetical protein